MGFAPSARGSGQRRYLVVRVGGITCALPSKMVHRVLRGLTVYPVPGSQPRLVGLAQADGEPLAVLDLLALLEGEGERAGGQDLTVVATAGPEEKPEIVGLAVDEALEVVSIPDRELSATGAGLVCGEASVGDEVVRVLDLRALGEGT